MGERLIQSEWSHTHKTHHRSTKTNIITGDYTTKTPASKTKWVSLPLNPVNFKLRYSL